MTSRYSATFKAYLDLCRVSNLPSIWTNVLCAFVLATGLFAPGQYLVLAVALSCFYLAGMCLNDVFDAEHDRAHRPSRPIPSGRVTLRGAVTFSAALLTAGFLLLLALPFRQGLLAALLLLITIIWYDRHHKKNPLSVLLMASCRFLVFAVTALSATGMLKLPVITAGSVQFLYVVSISLVARHENNRPKPFARPVIPLMLAGICLVDGLILAILAAPAWMIAGVCGALLMHAGQRMVRGD
ncbi:UbiA family prenyltransferase [Geobacter pelophilus]|uniref:UbiA family prenyltransferase n=1 Tax=Geoanaerobacter pelophilus TaxID=60036 RepID=A0AAW4L4J7_9BACT|nr:UbiA family prenyltransferase [Geoanaerobacter pelophilus]MBT0665818.1 UbiA family prenyltransferase [Geoanaerobacter pelophilus]